MTKLAVKPACSVDGCDRSSLKRGMCHTCYVRLRNQGVLQLLPPTTAAERLAARLERRSTGCLEWTGHSNEKGYGQISFEGRLVMTHRLAWELANGPIPDGLLVRHFACDNPPCCEPTHLRLGTFTDNTADMTSQGRGSNQQKTHCPAGHRYDQNNTYVNPRGYRLCRTCRQAATKGTSK